MSVESITANFSATSWKPAAGKQKLNQSQQQKQKKPVRIVEKQPSSTVERTPIDSPALPFVVGKELVDVGTYYTGRTVEAARPTVKPFDLAKQMNNLACETDLKRNLRHKWVMWNAWPRRSGPNPQLLKDLDGVVDYMAEFREGDVFQTVPRFCEVWNNLYAGSAPYAKIVVFKKGIKPVWEDPDNCKGGRFVIRGATIEETLSMFLVIVSRVMTGRLHGADYNDLCGVVLHAKGSDQLWIQIWNKDASDSEGVDRCKTRLNRLLNRTVAYQVHDQSLKMLKSRKQNAGGAFSKPQLPPPVSAEEAESHKEVEDFVRGFLELSLQ